MTSAKHHHQQFLRTEEQQVAFSHLLWWIALHFNVAVPAAATVAIQQQSQPQQCQQYAHHTNMWQQTSIAQQTPARAGGGHASNTYDRSTLFCSVLPKIHNPTQATGQIDFAMPILVHF
jgi:hypothetical protein